MSKQLSMMTTVLAAWLLTACSGGDVIDKNANTPDKAIKKTLVREWQQIRRYNCKGDLVSFQWETVVSPRQQVALYPNKTDNFFMLYTKNVDLDRKIGVSSFDFFIDAEQGFFSQWVRPGLNRLDYEFHYCLQKVIGPDGKPTGECTHTPHVQESGTVYFDITYNQIRRSEIGEYRPTPQECAPPPPTNH